MSPSDIFDITACSKVSFNIFRTFASDKKNVISRLFLLINFFV